MLSFTHTVISLPFGIYSDNLIFILISTFLFHLLADWILHWNIFPDSQGKFPLYLVFLDVAGGIIFSFAILGSRFFTLPVLTAILGGNAPDIIHHTYFLLHRRYKLKFAWLQPFLRFHDSIQNETANKIIGLIPQAVLIAIAVSLII